MPGGRSGPGPVNPGRGRGRPAVGGWPALAAGALAVLVSGCAAGAIPGLGTGGGTRNALAYSACMRSHGIADFPDPQNGGFHGRATPTTRTVNGVTLKESVTQYTSAEQACQHYLGEQHGAPASPRQQQQALAYARCMRAHGIANFPDPKVTANSFAVHLPPGLDPHSPQFQAAQSACQSQMPSPGGRAAAKAG